MGFSTGLEKTDKRAEGEIRHWERLSLESVGAIPMDMFNMMVALVNNGNKAITVFHWVRRIKDIKKQSDGSVILYTDKVAGMYLGQIMGKALEDYFQTNKIACVYRHKGSDIVNYFNPPDRKEKLSPSGAAILARAKEFSLPLERKPDWKPWIHSTYTPDLEKQFFAHWLPKTLQHEFAYGWLQYARDHLAWPKEAAQRFARDAGLYGDGLVRLGGYR